MRDALALAAHLEFLHHRDKVVYCALGLSGGAAGKEDKPRMRSLAEIGEQRMIRCGFAGEEGLAVFGGEKYPVVDAGDLEKSILVHLDRGGQRDEDAPSLDERQKKRDGVGREVGPGDDLTRFTERRSSSASRRRRDRRAIRR